MLSIQKPLHFLRLILNRGIAAAITRLSRPTPRHDEKLRSVNQHLEVVTFRRPLLRGPRRL